MRLDLYQAETARIATEQSGLLALAKQRLVDGLALSPLEQSGVLHALQILIPAWNAIIGLRNRIVHGYMNIDMQRVQELVAMGRYAFVTAFLLKPTSCLIAEESWLSGGRHGSGNS